MRTAAAIAAASLALAACATMGPAPSGKWALQTSAAAGSALFLEDGQGQVLRIACRRNPADLYLHTGRLRPSGEPVTLRIGEQSFSLAEQAKLGGLTATGPLPPAFPAALMSGGSVSVHHGGEALGPFPAPDQKTVAAFAIACRVAAG
jgi:hypothetical protein